MSRATRHATIAAAAAVTGLLATGCGTTASPAHTAAAALATVAASPLDTAVTTGTGTWAVTVMGGSPAQHNNFWQLFTRPAGATRWQLATPPGTADNGGLVIAPTAGAGLAAAFRPSQYLTYTPLIRTSDGGRSWSSLSPLDAALASVPGALAQQPAGGELLALTSHGTAEQAPATSAAWTTIATAQTLAKTAAGRRCALAGLTAAIWTPSGEPLLAGACAHPGMAGVFTRRDGAWQPAGPALPASLTGQRVTVLRLATAGNQTTALMEAGQGRTASLLTAWSTGPRGLWTVSPPLALGGAGLESASSGASGAAAVLTTRGTAALISPTSRGWRALPAPPPGTTTLAAISGGETDALAVRRNTLTVWRLPPGATAWERAQVITVPIAYGSSG